MKPINIAAAQKYVNKQEDLLLSYQHICLVLSGFFLKKGAL